MGQHGGVPRLSLIKRTRRFTQRLLEHETKAYLVMMGMGVNPEQVVLGISRLMYQATMDYCTFVLTVHLLSKRKCSGYSDVEYEMECSGTEGGQEA